MSYTMPMDLTEPLSTRPPRWLAVTTYITVVVMGGIGLSGMTNWLAQAAAVVLCAGFALGYTVFSRTTWLARWPWLYFTVQSVLVAGMLALPSRMYDALHFLLFILGIQAVTTLPNRRAIGWVVLLAGLSSGMTLLRQGPSLAGLIPLAFNAVAFLLVGAFGQAWQESEAARRRNEQLLAELRAAEQQGRELAVAEERNRLAREVHDAAGHRLTVAVVQLEGAQRLIATDPERAGRIIGTVREQLREGLDELRRTVSALRAVGEAGADLPLEAALRRLVQTFQASTGLPVALALPASLPDLPEPYGHTLYRAAQETLTNAQRHAAAGQVWLRVETIDGQILLTVSDDGRGWGAAAESASGFGLRGLRERVVALGGRVALTERAGGGVAVCVALPLPRAQPAVVQ